MSCKKLIAALSAITMTASVAGLPDPLMPVTTAAANIMPGDVNADEAVSIVDAVMLQKWLVKSSTHLTSLQNADLNKDNQVNVLDLCLLKRCLSADGQNFTGLVLNEVCTSNKKSLQDDAGNSPDWLELYNGSARDLNLSGVGLSEGKKNRYKFVFPDGTVLKAGDYLVVACDKTLTTTGIPYVAPFNLSATGETLYLTAPLLSDGSNGEDLDVLTVPELTTDVTYGRLQDEPEALDYLIPSPNAANTTRQSDFVESPLFSVEAGFYEKSFALELSSNQSATIYYTTDGSDPTTSKTAKQYADPIQIYDNTRDPNVLSARADITVDAYYSDNPYRAPSYLVEKGMIIRAACKNADNTFSKVVTNGYYIGKDRIGKTSKSYKDLKVVSIATDYDNLFDKDNGIYVVGSRYDGATYTYANDTRHKTNYNLSAGATGLSYTEDQIEKPCSMQIYENGELAYSADAGIRIGGNWSRGFAQKTLKLYAKSKYGTKKFKYDFFDGLTDYAGNPIQEFDKIVLHNGGSDCNQLHYRDELIQELCKDVDCMAKIEAEPCIVFLDGEFWGFYFIRQNFGPSSLEEQYGIPSDNVTLLEDGYFHKGTPEIEEDTETFFDWAMNADMRLNENYQKVADVIDIDSLIHYITIQTYINNSDWSMPNNYYNWKMWRSNTVIEGNPYADGKWRYVLYDVDQGCAMWGASDTRNSYDYNLLNNMFREKSPFNSCAVFYNLMNNETFRNTFQTEYRRICNTYFDSKMVRTLLDQYQTAYAPLVEESFRRFRMNYGSYEWGRTNIYDFFDHRKDYAFRYLDKLVASYENANSSVTGQELLTESTISFGWIEQDYDADGSWDLFAYNGHRFTTKAFGSYRSSLMVSYKDLHMPREGTYELRFTASCDQDSATMRAHFQNSDTYDRAFSKELTVSKKPETFVIPIDSLSDVGTDSLSLIFSYGYDLGTFTVTDIHVVRTS